MGKPRLAPGLRFSERTQCRRREELKGSHGSAFGFDLADLETPLLVPLSKAFPQFNLQNFIRL
jgi:hypothetical protein